MKTCLVQRLFRPSFLVTDRTPPRRSGSASANGGLLRFGMPWGGLAVLLLTAGLQAAPAAAKPMRLLSTVAGLAAEQRRLGPASVALLTNQPPSIQVTSPTNNMRRSYPLVLSLEVLATDSDGSVQSVEYTVDSVKFGQSTNFPFTLLWTNPPVGSHTVSAAATDNKGARTVSEAVTVVITATNALPVVSLTSPTNLTRLSAPASFTMEAQASDQDGTIQSVEFLVDGGMVNKLTSPPYRFAWDGGAIGDHALSVRATDNQGAQVVSTPITVTIFVGNLPPVILSQSPTETNFFAPGEFFNFEINAYDPDGQIVMILFSGFPYTSDNQLNWRILPGGQLQFTYYNFHYERAYGRFAIPFIIYDNAGGATTNHATFTIDKYPTVSISSPANGALFSSGTTLRLTAQASDPDTYGVDKVEFFVDGTNLLGTAFSSPYEFLWRNVPAGNHTLVAVATDTLGAATNSAPVSISVKRGPAIELLSPTNNSIVTFGDPMALRVNVTPGDLPVTRVDYFDGTTAIATVTNAPYSFAWTNAPAGLRHITASASDSLGGLATSATADVFVGRPDVPIPGIKMWLDAEDGVSADPTGRVSAWNDRTGLGNNVLQENADQRPVQQLNGPNGHAVVHFDGQNDVLHATLAGSSLFTSNAASILLVQRQTATNYANTTFTWNVNSLSNRVNLHLTFGGFLYFDFGNVLDGERLSAPKPTNWDGAYHVVEAYRSPENQGWLLVDGFQKTNGTVLGKIKTSSIGVLNVGGIPDAYFGGELAELIVYNRYLDESERAQVRNYFGRRYNLDVTGNAPPIASLTAPADGQIYEPGETIRLTAQASDPEGRLVRVDFYIDGVKVGSAAAAPFEFVWQGAGLGSHTLLAQAVDDIGKTGDSVLTSVAVMQAQIPVKNLGLWLDAGQGVQLDNGAVRAWKDRGAYGIELSQAEAAKRPGLVNNGRNAKPVIRFDGTNTFLTAQVEGRRLFTTNAGTVYVVQKQVGTHDANTTITWQAPDYKNRVNLHLAYAGRFYWDFGDVSAGGRISVAQPANWADAYHLVEAYRSDSTGWLWMDGQELTRGSFTDVLDTSLTGQLLVGGLPDQMLQGDIAEIIVYSRALSDLERATVRGYLGSKYDLAASNAPPVVTISSPTPTSIVRLGRDAKLSATATDPDDQVISVEFFVGPAAGALTSVGKVTSAPYEWTWRPPSTGNYSVKALATDERLATTESAMVSFTVLTPNQLPVISITSPLPTDGFKVGELVPLKAAAQDPDGTVVKVAFYDGTNLIKELTAPPYEYQWPALVAGRHGVVATALDNSGEFAQSAELDVLIYDTGGVNIPEDGLTLWLDAGRKVTVTGGGVAAWQGRGAFGHTVTQDDLAKRPLLVTNAINGQPVIRFDGTNDFLAGRVPGQQFFQTNAGTLYVVQKQVGTHAPNTTFTWDAPDFQNRVNLHLAYGGSLYFDFGSVTGGGRLAANQPPWWPDAFHVVEAYRSGSTGWLFSEGQELLRAQFTDTLDNSVVGDLILGGKGDSLLQGDIAEILVYERGLNEAERQQVRSYLGGKYHLPVTTNVPPVAALIPPAAGTKLRVNQDNTLAATATDSDGQVIAVEFYAGLAGSDLVWVGGITNQPYQILWRPITDGDYQVKIVATDDRGGTNRPTVVTVHVLPENAPPTVSLVGPISGVSRLVGDTVLLEAQAADTDGTVKQVVFLDGTNVLKVLTATPYQYLWTATNAGLHLLKATAMDEESGVGESLPVEAPVYGGTLEIPADGLRLWLDAGQQVEVTNSRVAVWRDRSLYDHAVSQGNAAKRPLLATNALNSKPVLRFDGTNSFLTGRADGRQLFATNAGTIYVVQKQVGTHAPNTTLTWDAPDYQNRVNLHLAYGGSLYFDFGSVVGGGRVGANQPFWWPDAYHIVEAYRNADEGWLFCEGATLARGKFTDTLDNAVEGDLVVGGAGAALLQGDVAEIIVYNRGLNETERLKVRGYLGGKYQLPITTNIPPIAAVSPLAAGVKVRINNAFTLAATASDPDGQVMTVEFFAGLTGGDLSWIGAATKAPYTVAWTPTVDGDYNVRVRATDNRGGQTESAIATITVLAPNQLPTVTLLSPASGASAQVGDTVLLKAQATDGDGTVKKVVFWDGANPLQEFAAGPFEYAYTFTNAGLHLLAATATDDEGGVGASDEVEAPVYAGQLPLPVEGLRLWLDAGQGVTLANGGSVVAWQDRGVYGTSVRQDVAAKRPAYVTSGPKGKPVLRFDGANDVLTNRVDGRRLFGTNAASIYIVQKQIGTNFANTTFTWQGPDYQNRVNLHLAYLLNLYFDFGNVNAGGRLGTNQPAGWGDAFHTVEAYRNGDTGLLWVDGAELVRGKFTGTLNTALEGDLILGALASSVFQGDLAEVIVFNRALADWERAWVQGYLGDKYGLFVPTNLPPQVSLTSPAAGAKVDAPVQLSATASDPDGIVTSVDFYANDVLVGSATKAPFGFYWQPSSIGAYRLVAAATDNRGAKTNSATVTVTVQSIDKPPTVALTKPTADLNLNSGPAPVDLAADASDPDGTIVKVEFYNGTTLLAADTTAPWSFTWPAPAVGTNSVTARAYDNKGLIANSAARTIVVLPVIRGAVLDATGRFRFTFYGQPAQRYAVEASDDLSSWNAVGTLQALNGISDFVEALPATAPHRYYRVKRQ